MPSSPFPTNRHQLPCGPCMLRCHPDVPTPQADFWVSFLWVCECQHRVGIRHQRNQNVTKRWKTPLSKSHFYGSIKLLHVIPFLGVDLKFFKCSLWKGREALQHQRSSGMHPLSEHCPSSIPPHPHHKQKHQNGGTKLLTSFLIKPQEVYEVKLLGTALKSCGFRLSCVWQLDAPNVLRTLRRDWNVCVRFREMC